jgi:LPXTG-motif cell wall-anchored protein
MKKLALAVFATALIGFGHAPANAQTPPPTIKPIPPEDVVECGESDVITVNCQEYYFEAVPPTTPAPATTTTISAQIPPGPLPSTGSGVSPILGIGAALLVGGGVVVVASRRRSSATAH